MKKALSILLALVLCLCCCAALAEGEKVKITIVDSDGVTVLNEFEIAKGEAVTDIGYVKEGYVLQGVYVTPALLGGADDQMLSYYIARYTNVEVNWGMACALGALLLVATLVLYSVYRRFGKAELSLG